MSAEVWHMQVEPCEVHGQIVEVKRLVQRWRAEPGFSVPAARFWPVGWYRARTPRCVFTGSELLAWQALRIYRGEPYLLRVRR